MLFHFNVKNLILVHRQLKFPFHLQLQVQKAPQVSRQAAGKGQLAQLRQVHQNLQLQSAQQQQPEEQEAEPQPQESARASSGKAKVAKAGAQHQRWVIEKLAIENQLNQLQLPITFGNW